MSKFKVGDSVRIVKQRPFYPLSGVVGLDCKVMERATSHWLFDVPVRLFDSFEGLSFPEDCLELVSSRPPLSGSLEDLQQQLDRANARNAELERRLASIREIVK